MLDLEDRLDELKQLGLHQRTAMVSGPQGPRVVLDGRPVLLLCSGDALGLADHPRVRQAAADAAMRWGVGAGAARVCRTMTLHRRLEERLGDVHAGSARRCCRIGAMANLGVIPRWRGAARSCSRRAVATARSRRLPLSGADIVATPRDAEHLAWALRQCDGQRR